MLESSRPLHPMHIHSSLPLECSLSALNAASFSLKFLLVIIFYIILTTCKTNHQSVCCVLQLVPFLRPLVPPPPLLAHFHRPAVAQLLPDACVLGARLLRLIYLELLGARMQKARSACLLGWGSGATYVFPIAMVSLYCELLCPSQ